MITLTKEVELAINYAIHAQPTLEVGGFAKVQEDERGITLVDVIVPPQTVGGASVHMGDQIEKLGMSGFEWMMLELAKRGETLSQWNCWWHSHSTMEAFASSTDTDTLEKFAEMVEDHYAFGLVGNTRGHWYAWMHDVRPPWRHAQDKVTVRLSSQREKVEPIYSNIMKMMEQVEKAEVGYGKDFGSYGQLPAALVPGSSTRRSIDIVWCDEHNTYSDDCPKTHIVPRSMICQHYPNCGVGGCMSKRERKEMGRLRAAHRQAGSTRHFSSGAVLLGVDDIDEDDWDGQFDAAFIEAEMYK